MTRAPQSLIFVIFLLGLAANSELGCDPESMLHWPGFLLIGMSGFLTCALWGPAAWGARLPSLTCVGSLLIFAAWIAIRGSFSPVAYLARADLALIGVCSIVYVLTSTTFAGTNWRIWLVGSQLSVAVANIGIAIYQMKFDPGYHPLPWIERATPQPGGLFENPNHFAAFLLFPACVLGGFLVAGPPKMTTRLLAALGLGLCLGGLVIAVSRTGFIAAGAGIFALAVFAFWPARQEGGNRWAGPLTVATLAMVLALAGRWVFQNPDSPAKAELREQIAAAMDSPRFAFWKTAWSQAEIEPVIGMGSRTYEIYSRQLRADLPAEMPDQAFVGNEPLQLLAEYGWIGLGLGLICVLIHLWHGVRGIRRELAERRAARAPQWSASLALTIGAICALLALTVMAFFESYLHAPSVSVIVAMTLGILANPGGASTLGRPAAAVAGQAGAILAGALLLFFGNRYMQSDWLQFKSEVMTPRHELEARYEWLRSASAADPADPFLPIAEAELALEIYGANLDVAANAYLRSYDLYPQNPHMLVSLGQTLDELGRSAEATLYYEEALYWAPSYGVTRYAYATHLLRTGREEEANDAFQWANEAPAYPWTAQVRPQPAGNGVK